MRNEYDFSTENQREQVADILDQCRRLVLSPGVEDETKCAELLSRACELMQLLTEGGK